jgi:hypothetical protein
LTIEVTPPKTPSSSDSGSDTGAVRFSLRLAPNATVAAWCDAVRGGDIEAVPPISHAGGLAVRGGSDLKPGGFRVEVTNLVTEGAWPAPIDAKKLSPFARALHECIDPAARRNDYWEQPFLIEVDDRGRLIRCEGGYPFRLDSPGFSCRCDVLKRLNFGRSRQPSGTHRRARFQLRTEKGTAPSTEPDRTVVAMVKKNFSATDESVLLSGTTFRNEDISACMQASDNGQQFLVQVSAHITADGTVAELTTQWPADTPSDIRSCVDTVLRRARFNCPVTGSAEVTGPMHIKVRRLKNR